MRRARIENTRRNVFEIMEISEYYVYTATDNPSNNKKKNNNMHETYEYVYLYRIRHK